MTSEQLDKEIMEHQEAAQPDTHLDRLLIGTDLDEPWYKSIVRGIREALNPPKLPPLEITSTPVEGTSLGDIQAVEVPWYKSLIQNVKDLINPPKLPPLEVTSKPVEVKSIWGAYGGGEGRSVGASVLIHVGVVGLLLLIFQSPQMKKMVQKVSEVYFVPPYKPKLPPAAQKAGGGGGGGMHEPKPVVRGEAPKPALKQFMPPALAVPKPKLPQVPTITAPAPPILADNYGDPLSKALDVSGGPGSQGFGQGHGGGIGSGNGDGYGPGSGHGTGGGAYRIGGDVSAPQILSKVEPEYSEEARKAKYQGTVVLSIVVDEHGMPRDIRVIRPLGLGLDEKAIEAVQHWRFRPGMKGGRPVATQASVEVNFRLL
ncbi:MAG: TonB family protein [Acidobacteriaceae bacterium]|nr:TonB family protein [Acidobacteriaceae bacterium]